MEHSDGVQRLYFPAFDSPATNNGLAEGLDGEQFGQHYGRLKIGDFTFTGAYGRRRKDVPTASFNTIFNEQVDRLRTTDRHGLADMEYGRDVGETRVALRASYDRFTYDGYYPFDGSIAGIPKYVGHDSVTGARWTASARLTRRLPLRQVVVFGAEFIDNIQQTQTSQFEPSLVVPFTADRSSTQRAVFLTDEVKLGRHVILNGGLRYDSYETFDRVTPRTALIVMPSAHQSFKYLYGRAFRAPSAYERHEYYFGSQVNDLRPESIDTHEFVWERYTGDWLRTSVSAYRYNADRLITLTASNDPAAFLAVTYVNEGQVSAKGLELEAQMRLWRGAEGHMSYALQEATDRATGLTLMNSPRQMLKGRVSAPLFGNGSSVALEVLGIGNRMTVGGNRLDSATTADVTVIKPLGSSIELVGTVRNLFDVDYAVPGGSQHLQDTIPQNGRTFRAGLRVKIK
jgi:iron complex outermembrane receptor protein